MSIHRRAAAGPRSDPSDVATKVLLKKRSAPQPAAPQPPSGGLAAATQDRPRRSQVPSAHKTITRNSLCAYTVVLENAPSDQCGPARGSKGAFYMSCSNTPSVLLPNNPHRSRSVCLGFTPTSDNGRGGVGAAGGAGWTDELLINKASSWNTSTAEFRLAR